MTATAIKYGIVKKTSLGFDQAVEAVTAAFADEGFGILTEIDVQAVLKKKLDIEQPKYLIPGACNPQLASTVLDAEPCQSFRCRDVVPRVSVVVEVTDPDVSQRVELSANLPEFAADNRLVICRLVLTEGRALSGNPEAEMTSPEKWHARFIHASQLVDLPRPNQVLGFQDLAWG